MLVAGIIVGLIGAVLMGVFVANVRLRLQLRRRGVRVPGSVVDTEHRQSSGTTTVWYAYRDGEGTEHLASTQLGRNVATGTEISVLYDPDDPTRAVPSFVAGWYLLWLLFAVTLLGAGLSLVMAALTA